MPVLYNNYLLRPVQSVTFARPKQALGDGRQINSKIQATVKGTIVPDNPNGTVTSISTEARMSVILAKQKEIREALSVDGKIFEVQGWDGQPPAKFQATIADVQFEDGPWLNTCAYIITLESSEFSGETSHNYNVESASESWSFDEGEQPKVTKVTHTVTAKGRLLYDATGAIPVSSWEYAKAFVVDQLGLGWTTIGATFSPASGSTLASLSKKQPLSTLAWNHVITDEIDETEGTYRATETWLLCAQPYTEEYTLNLSKIDDKPNTTVSVAIHGSIKGLYENLNDYDARYTNASTAWATISTQLASRANTISGVTLNSHPTVYTIEHDRVGGTISYQAEYNNRVVVNDTWETYQVGKRRHLEDYKTSVTINGTVNGILYLDTDTDPSIRYTRAQARWETVKGLTYARAAATSGIAGLQPYPINAEVTDNPTEGTITYSYEYDNRPFLSAKFDYTVVRKSSRDDPRSTVTVEGTVTGMLNEDPFSLSDINTRYNNAKTYFNGIEANLLGIAALLTDVSDIYLEVWTKSVSHTPLEGKISFTYEFTSMVKTFAFALSESISISEDDVVPVIAEFAIPGKADGPIIQDIGTVTSKKRRLTIELVVPLPRFPGYVAPPSVDINPYTPTGTKVRKTQDTFEWKWGAGRWSRTVSWTYNP